MNDTIWIKIVHADGNERDTYRDESIFNAIKILTGEKSWNKVVSADPIKPTPSTRQCGLCRGVNENTRQFILLRFVLFHLLIKWDTFSFSDNMFAVHVVYGESQLFFSFPLFLLMEFVVSHLLDGARRFSSWILWWVHMCTWGFGDIAPHQLFVRYNFFWVWKLLAIVVKWFDMKTPTIGGSHHWSYILLW